MNRNAFVIKEQGTENFLFGRSFQNIGGGNWYYESSTGICTGFEYYGNKERAEEVLHRLSSISSKLNIGKVFEVVEVDVEEIPLGLISLEEVVAI